MNFNNFTGYVLAGGKSSRMGTDKAFLRFGGETFASRALNALSTVCENRIVIVLNQTQTHFIENLPREIPYIFDVFENRGALGGIHAALQNCQTKYAIILAVDLPFVTSEAIENLAKIVVQSKDCVAVAPIQTDERMQPLCGVYDAEYCLDEIDFFLTNESSNAVKDFLINVPVCFVQQKNLADDKNLLLNVNTRNDFDKTINL